MFTSISVELQPSPEANTRIRGELYGAVLQAAGVVIAQTQERNNPLFIENGKPILTANPTETGLEMTLSVENASRTDIGNHLMTILGQRLQELGLNQHMSGFAFETTVHETDEVEK